MRKWRLPRPEDTTTSIQPPTRNSTRRTLEGKVAVISGSSSGIGAAIARELAARGAQVTVNHPHAGLRAEAESVLATLETEGIAVEADLSTIDGPGILAKAAFDKFGRIDIVVNNAALAVNKPFENQTLDDWDLLVNLNGRGTFLLTQECLKYLTKTHGRIINICSASARAPPPMQTIYAGTKGMVDSFTRCWAKELPPKYGCTVNSVSPGPTRTEGFAAAGGEVMKILQPVIETTPCGKRMGETYAVAYAVAMLAEESASWICGNHVMVSGGLHID